MNIGLKGRTSIAILVVVAFTAGILSATMGANWFGAGDRAATPARAVPADLQRTDVSAATFEDAFVSTAERINESVVQIRSEQVRRLPGTRNVNPFEGTPFGEFFRMPDQQPQEFRSEALGSGVVIRSDGYIVTNNHVVDGAEELQVVLANGTFHKATVVGKDPESDLAVIRIDADGLRAVPFGRIADVRIGQWVMAFGSPLAAELGNTVTSGIVSALHRTSPNLTRLNLFASFIQTDAAINPGNSGGPLVNLAGELIGINSAIYSRSGGSQGIGFAIPVDVVESVTRQLVENGSVERGFLGVNFDAVSPALSQAAGVPRGSAQVTAVTPDAPAAEAGLREGDIITHIDGRELRSSEELRTTIGNMAPGDRPTLTVHRDGGTREIAVRLGKRSEFLAQAAENQPAEGAGEDALESMGLTLQALDAQRAESMGLENGTRGVLVTAVDAASDAYRSAELRQGDVIVEAGRKPVRSVQDFREVVEASEEGKPFMVKVLRASQGQVRTFFTALTRPG